MIKISKKRKELDHFVDFLKTIGDASRLRIICLLFRQKQICVSEVAQQSGLSVADTSHHLRVLAKKGILKSSRRGKEVCYEPAIKQNKFLADIKRLVCKYR